MQYTPTIKDVQLKLQEWRMTKRYRAEPMTDSLRAIVKQLIPYHTISSLCKSLNLSISVLQSLEKFKPEHLLPTNENDSAFIPFRLVPDSKASLATCTIVNTKGNKLIIDVADVQPIIKTFLCCN